MKYLVLSVLFCIVYLTKNVESAKYCYQCISCSGYGTNTSCPTGTDTCLNLIAAVPGWFMTIKGCVPAAQCPQSVSLMLAGYGFSSNCCSGDTCNGALDILKPQKFLIMSISALLSSSFMLFK